MWLEVRSLTFAVARFFEERIEGHQLDTLDEGQLRSLGFLDRYDRRLILAAIAEDFKNGEYVGGKAQEKPSERQLKADSQVAKTMGGEDKAVVDLWGCDTGVNGDRIAIKCQMDGEEPVVFLVQTPQSFAQLKDILFENLGRSFTLHFEDEEGDRFPLASDDDFETVLIASEESTFTVVVSKPRPSVRGSKARALDRVGVPVIHVDAFGLISFANECAIAKLGHSLQNYPMFQCIPALEEKHARQLRRLDDVEVLCNDETSFRCNLAIAPRGASACVVTLLLTQ